MMALHRLTAVHLVIAVLAHSQAIGDLPSSDIYYIGTFSDDVVGCPDFDNKFMVMDLNVATSDEDSSIMVLEGTIDLDNDITPQHTVSVSVCKIELSICELIYTTMGSPCETLKETSTPWYPLLAAFNRDECNIPKGTYIVENLEISLDYAKDCLNHQFVAEYEVKVQFFLEQQQLSCYDMNVKIEEKQN